MGYQLKTVLMTGIPVMDGTWGFYASGADYLVGGWDGVVPTYKTVFKSVDNGLNWTALADFNHKFHTAATCVVDGVGYIVGGDQLSPSVDGDWRRSSHKFESATETWTQIAANPGIANRCLGGMVYFNGSFFLVGGQDDNAGTTLYDTVLRSDDGLVTFTSIQADTRTQGFSNPLSWGSLAVHQNEIWSVCGSRHSQPHGRFIFSSADGVTWTYRGIFRGMARTYCQVLSHNGRLWVFNGHNSRFDSTGNPTGNLRDVWTIDTLNGGRIVQTYQGVTGWSARHAMSIWSNPYGIMCALGISNPCWMFEQ